MNDDGRIEDSAVCPNEHMLIRIMDNGPAPLAIEMIASYGMPVGKEVFETCVWIGRFVQAHPLPETVQRVTRNEVKNHLCGSSKAKDANIRQALIDIFGSPGVKAKPGGTYGVRSHAWAALGVAATVRGITR